MTLRASTVKVRSKAGRRKKLTDGQWKKRVWTQFSIWVRTREADSQGFVACITCGTKRHWLDMQAGHFIRGRLNANLFDERGCHAQCYQCNISFQGNVVLYYKWMLSRYGQEVIDELLAQNTRTRKWRPGELQALHDEYRRRNAGNSLLLRDHD